ncbi:MAG: hypothetical protein FWH52_01100 [Synergistaceae bacterium]|nr:hypothetical protein [Synergistaceae bacterium]
MSKKRQAGNCKSLRPKLRAGLWKVGDYINLRYLRNESGMTSLGYLLVSFVVLGVFLLLFEFYRIYAVIQNVEIELSRAANIAVDLSMMDLYRRDHILELDSGLARESFYSYLYTEMQLDRNLRRYDDRGNEAFWLNIEELFIQSSPPELRLRASISMRPTYFGNIFLENMRFPLKAASQNKRLEV